MKNLIALLMMIILSGCAALHYSLLVPDEIKEYCQRITDTGDSMDQAMKTCVQHEMEAREKLADMTIPARVVDYCYQLSDATGSSYQVLLTCVAEKMGRKELD